MSINTISGQNYNNTIYNQQSNQKQTQAKSIALGNHIQSGNLQEVQTNQNNQRQEGAVNSSTQLFKANTTKNNTTTVQNIADTQNNNTQKSVPQTSKDNFISQYMQNMISGADMQEQKSTINLSM